MATASPRTRAAAKPAPAKAEAVEVEKTEELDESALVKIPAELENRGRTRQGEGNEMYFNLALPGVARGQIFTTPDVIAVKVLLVRNTAATA